MNKKFYRRFYNTLIKPYILEHLICFIFMLLYSLLSIVFPNFFKLIIDDAISNNSINKVIIYVIIMTLVVLLMLICKRIQIIKSVKLGQKIVFNLKTQIITKLLSYSKTTFNNYKIGDIVSILENDVQNAEILTSSIINEFLANIITVIGLFFIIFKANYLIALSTLTLAIAYTFCQKLYGKKIKHKSIALSKSKGDVLSLLQEFIGRITDIKMINLEKLYLNKYNFEQRKYFQTEYDLAVTTNNSTIISTIFQSMGLVLILCIGSILVLNKNITLGVLFSLIIYVERIYSPIISISNAYINLKKVQASLERVCKLTDEKDSIIKNGQECFSSINNIQLENLSFGYDNHKLFNNINLYIKNKEKIAIVGSNGSGKTSLINLLLRIQEGYTGKIYYDGKDIKEYDLEYFRKNVICISQKPIILNETIRKNILLDNDTISDDMLNKVIRLVCLENDICKFKKGLDTYVSEKKLSEGQKQKLALARLFIIDPKIIILDEPTAALDIQSEKIICNNIYEYFKEKTIITITHREELLKYCDTVYKVKNNKIIKEQKV